jgi:hypothetical protein
VGVGRIKECRHVTARVHFYSVISDFARAKRQKKLMASCALCGKSVPKLAKSHVYPKALHLQFADVRDDLPPIMINRKADYPGQAVQKSLGGVYGEFVCPTCERDLFGPADDAFMRLHYQLAVRPLPDAEIRMAASVVPGESDLVHRFALQTLWRWAAFPGSFVEQVDSIGYGPVIERIHDWLLNPAGTLWTDHDVAVIYRIAEDSGFAMPPCGGWRAGAIFMTVGNFTFFISSRSRGLPGLLHANRLRPENGVRVLVTTQMRSWITDPISELIADERMEQTDEFLERMRLRSRSKGRNA